MPATDLRYTAYALSLNPGQTRVLHCDYGTSLAGRTFAAVLDDIDLEATIDGTIVDIIFDGALTEDLSTRTHHTWYLYDTTAGDDPLQVEFGGPVRLSTKGVELPDDSVVVTSRDVTVNVTVLGEPGPQGPPGEAGEGGGAVDSVNGQTGVVVLDATDVGADPAGSAAAVASLLADEVVERTTADDALDGRVGALELLDPVLEGDSRLTDARTPTGAAGGVLSGTFPNPGFAADMATQAELDTEAATRAAADTALDGRLDTIEALGDLATQAELDTHAADTTAVHGIADTSALLDTADIGTSVQAHSAVLDATTASFTTADETKLDGVEAGAQVNDVLSVDGQAGAVDLSGKYVAGFEWDGDSYEAGAISVYVSDDPPDNSVGNDGDIWIPSEPTDLLGFEPVQTPASQAEMEAGTEAAIRSMSPLRVAQAIAALGSGGGLTQEQAEDIVAALIDDNSDLDWTYDDINASLVAAIKSGAVTNAMLAGSIDLAKLATDPLARANHTGTQASSTIADFTEAVQDLVGGMVSSGTETGIAVTYDDTNGRLDFVAEVTQAELDLKADDTEVVFQPGILVNGSFGIWQRGAGPFTADGAYCANNWIIDLVGTSTISVTYDDVNTLDIWSGRCLEATYTHNTASRIYQNYRDWQQTRTRKVTFRCWAKTSVASAVRIAVNDGVTRTYSSYHTGSGGWEQLTVTHDVSATNDRLEHELWMGATGTHRFDTADSFPYLFAVPASVPYWSADPSIERVRTNRWYQEIPVTWQGYASGNNQTFIVPVTWSEMAGSPTGSVVAGTRTNVHSIGFTVTGESGGYYTVVSAAPGAVTVTGDEVDLVVNP